jgi:phosphatidylethanolamine-binding protein (PEBP) family uncharacterized protein
MAHRYRFALHALDAPLDLEPGCTVGELHQAIAVHGLAQAQLSGVFASATAP